MIYLTLEKVGQLALEASFPGETKRLTVAQSCDLTQNLGGMEKGHHWGNKEK